MIYDRKRIHKILGVLFAAYSLFMLWLLFVRNRSGIWEDSSGYWEYVKTQYNLAPFQMIRDYWHVLTNREYYIEKWEAAAIYRYNARQAFINLFGNIGMLIPFGFFLPAVFKRQRKLWVTLGTVLGIMVVIEIIQLFTLSGHCDVDDLILNLTGASIGYFGFWLLGKWIKE